MKSRDLILVVDFGTSNVRASLVAVRDGKIMKNASARSNALKVSLMGVS